MNSVPFKLRNRRCLGLDIFLCRHCNLRCKKCSRYCNIAKPEFYSADDIYKDIELICSRHINIGFVSLNGGEPLLHPEITRIIYGLEELRQKYDDNHFHINVFTNGKKFLNMSQEFYDALKFANVTIIYTKYPKESGIDYDKIRAKCREIGIPHFNNSYFEFNIFDMTKNNFGGNFLKTTPDCGLENYRKRLLFKFLQCVNICPNIWQGKIFKCCRVPFIDSANEYWGLNYKIEEDDFIRVENLYSLQQYFDFIFSAEPFCRYCDNKHMGIPYEWGTGKPELSDIIYENNE